MEQHEGGILSAEQVQRIRAKERKQRQRAREKSAEAAAQAETPDVFWQRNREVANEASLAELQERESCVFALLHDIETVMEGDVLDAEFVIDVEQEVKDDIEQNGICQMEVLLLSFWKSADVFAKLTQRGDATATFVRYGIIAAIPGHRLAQSSQWLQTQKASQTTTPTDGYVQTLCMNFADCRFLPDSIPQSVADEYHEKGILYRCHKCLTVEKASRAKSVLEVERRRQGSAADIYDQFGRFKTGEER